MQDVLNNITQLLAVEEISTADLSGLINDVTSAVKLAEVLKQTQSLTSLDLSGCQLLNSEGWLAIAEALKVNKSLTTLKLEGSRFTLEFAQEFAKMLKSNDSLIHLDFLLVELDTAGWEAIAEALEMNKSLTSLNFGFIDASTDVTRAIISALKKNKGLIDLNLAGHRIDGTTGKEIAELIKNNSLLSVLNLHYADNLSPSSIELIAEALKTNPSLKELNLSDCKLSSDSMKNIINALKANKSLKSLNLCGNYIDEENAALLAEVLVMEEASLASLDLSNCHLSSYGINVILSALKTNKSLKSLHLCEHIIDGENAHLLAEILSMNDTLLELIALSDCDLTPESTQTIANALETNKSLTSLMLGKTKYPGPFLEALQTNSLLRSLSLSASDLTISHSEMIANFLYVNGSLTFLDLSETSLNAEGIKQITEALKANKTLTELDLSDNELGIEGAESIADLLKNNSSLTSLNIEDCHFGPADKEIIIKTLTGEENFSLISLNFLELDDNELRALGTLRLIMNQLLLNQKRFKTQKPSPSFFQPLEQRNDDDLVIEPPKPQ